MIYKYICEKCNEEFFNEDDCREHELNCNVVHTFVCDKCEKVIEYSNDYKDELSFKASECWQIDLGAGGYGSKLDCCNVRFNLCDDCLLKIIKSLTNEKQKQIFNLERDHL